MYAISSIHKLVFILKWKTPNEQHDTDLNGGELERNLKTFEEVCSDERNTASSGVFPLEFA